jgi:rare lipoprotein A
MRQSIGIPLASLVASACAIGWVPAHDGWAANHGSGRVERQVPISADICGGNPDPCCSQMRSTGISLVGKAAWYNLVGRHTATGETLDTVTATAAHRHLPLASYAKVTNLNNGRSVVVKINDRGPYTRGRILDLSPRAAGALDMKRVGVAAVAVEPLFKQAALGLRTRMLAKRLGLSPAAIDAAWAKGCRRSRWLPALSQLIDVPVEILLDTSPDDPAAVEYRLPALLRAADIRMRHYRFERPSSPLVARHQTGRYAHAIKRGASKASAI